MATAENTNVRMYRGYIKVAALLGAAAPSAPSSCSATRRLQTASQRACLEWFFQTARLRCSHAPSVSSSMT